MVQPLSPSGEESFFKREDIKTMAKDLAKAKGGQVEKHRQDVGGFKFGYKKREQQDKDILEKEKVEQAKKQITEQEIRKIQERKQKIEEIEKIRLEKIQKQEIENKAKEQKKIDETKKILEKTPEELLVEKKLEIKQEFLMLANKKKPLEQQKSQDIEKIQEIKILLNPILEKEEKIEEKKKKAEEKEKTIEGIEEKQKIEEKRWKIEEKRREVEAERWEVEEKIEKINKDIVRIDMDYQIILDREEELKKQVEDIEEKQAIIKAKKEKALIEKDIIVLKSELSVAIKEKNEFEQEISQAKIEFQNLAEQEKEIERKIEIVEEKEKTASNTQAKREIEKQRWEIGDRRKEIEQKRVSIEKQIRELEVQLKEKQWEVQKKQAREDKINEQIQEIDEFLDPEIPEEEEEEEEKEEKIVGTALDQRARTVPNDANTKTSSITEVSSGKMEKTAPVRTAPVDAVGNSPRPQGEDCSQIRENRATIATKVSSEKISSSEKPSNKIVFRPVAKKLSSKEKLWTRFIIVFLLLAIIASVLVFWYWYLRIEKQLEPQTENTLIETSETENILPAEIIPSQNIEIIETQSKQEIQDKFSQVFEKQYQTNELTSVVIKFQKNSFVDLSKFLQSFDIEYTPEFYANFNANYNLFIYAQEQGNRIGFITEIKEQQKLENDLKILETSMEKDFNLLFTLIGKEKPALSSVFKTIKYKNNFVDIRYQTFSNKDLGICYAFYNNYFIWTSSLQSIEKIIDAL